jgi:hypothetical protein
MPLEVGLPTSLEREREMMNLDPLLRAHGFMHVERPPELWHAEADDVRLVPLLGEMIAFGLSRGNVLSALTLNAANVVVEDDGDGLAPRGEYVALSVTGKGDWRPEWIWRPEDSLPGGAYTDLGRALADSGVAFAYARYMGDTGSITAFVRRAAL